MHIVSLLILNTMEHIYGLWTILMLKILQAHLLRAFFANLKIYAIYALHPESFCDKNLAVWNVFAFSDSAYPSQQHHVKNFWAQKFLFKVRSIIHPGSYCYRLTLD